MTRMIALVLAATLLSGCAVYASPPGVSVYAPAPGVYVAPPPVYYGGHYYYGRYPHRGWPSRWHGEWQGR
jgi:hypothetical protein